MTYAAALSKEDPELHKGAMHVEKHLKADGRKVQILGHVKDGRVQLDEGALLEMKTKYPNAKMVFVAVNAPFDPIAAA